MCSSILVSDTAYKRPLNLRTLDGHLLEARLYAICASEVKL